MLNKKRNLEILILILIFTCYGCKEKRLQSSSFKPSPETGYNNNLVLNRLTSVDEGERFKTLEEMRKKIKGIDINDIEVTLTSIREKNVSTLIFVLMESQNDCLYKLSPAAKRTLENSQGSFPNIAYYYARVNPQTGLSELFRLYTEHVADRIPICKGIGEVSNSEALNFLLFNALQEKEKGRRIIPLLAGLQAYNNVIHKKEILFFLEQSLDREEVISLSKLKTHFTQNDLIGFWKTGNSKALFSIEYILNNLSENFDALQAIVDYELANKRHEKAIELMMSDSMIRSKDEDIKKYRDTIIDKVQKMNHR
ncbi:MAG: hypothetical protein ACMUIU_10330 [bacterium]